MRSFSPKIAAKRTTTRLPKAGFFPLNQRIQSVTTDFPSDLTPNAFDQRSAALFSVLRGSALLRRQYEHHIR
jgi:hypothetical protein